MSETNINLGPVSAYALAKTKGYTGTEAEFAQLMANYATVGQQAAQSAAIASTAANTANTKASEAATSANNAATSATNASRSATAASQSATAASNSASSAATSAQTANAKSTEATNSANAASQSAGSASQYSQQALTARTAAQAAQTAAESAKTAAEAAAQDAHVEYTGLSNTVSSMNTTLNSRIDGVSDDVDDLSDVVATKASTTALQAETARATAEESRIEALFTAPTEEAVADWLEAHPEATTTVQDGAISYAKLDSTLKAKADDVDDLKSAIENNLSVDVISLAGLEIGNINSNGDNRDSTTRLRTIKKYPVKAGSYIHVVAGDNQVYMIGKYVNNTFSISGWYSGDITIKTDDDCEVRFLIRYATETAITVADNKCIPQIISSKDYAQKSQVDELQNMQKLVSISITPQFELGTINSGVSAEATDRVRTNAFIPITDESIISVKIPAKYGRFTLYYYSTESENDFIDLSPDYVANTEYTIKSKYNGYLKIRFYYTPATSTIVNDLAYINSLFTIINPGNALKSALVGLSDVQKDVANTWVRRYHTTEIGSLNSGVPTDSTKYCRSSDFVQINKGDVVQLLATSIQYNAVVYFFYENNAGSYCSATPVLSVEPNHNVTYISPVTGYYKFRATYIPQRDMTSDDLALFNTLVYSESSPIYTEVIDTINANPYVPKVANVHSIAHRGFSTAPENTIIAFKQAKRHGFDYVETDVRFTSDNVPVLLHDATINRTARDENGNTLAETVNIEDITYADSQAYDFGSYKNSYYAGTKIPTFTEFMRLCRNIGLKPFIELKTGTQQQIADLYSIVKSFGMINDVCWLGEGIYLNYIKAIDNTATLCYISRNPSIDVIAGFKTGSNLVIAGIEDNAITNEFVQGCMQNDIPLLDWTINVDETIISSNPYITWYMTNGPMAEHVLYDNDMT